ncbi:MAG: hypothetical protein R2867_23425 [Caldilineaceae bacterium]
MGTVREATALMAIDPEVENIGIAWHWAIAEKQIDLLQRTLLVSTAIADPGVVTAFVIVPWALPLQTWSCWLLSPSPPSAWLYFLAKLYSERSSTAGWQVTWSSQNNYYNKQWRC